MLMIRVSFLSPFSRVGFRQQSVISVSYKLTVVVNAITVFYCLQIFFII